MQLMLSVSIDALQKHSQIEAWPAHKAECKQIRLAAEEEEAGVIANPYSMTRVNEIQEYALAVAAEVMVIAWRSAFELGRPTDKSCTHLLALNFERRDDAPTLRERFSFSHTELISIDEEMERRRFLPADRLAMLPTREQLTGGAARRAQNAKGEHISATMMFYALNTKTGGSSRCYIADCTAVVDSVWPYLPLDKLNFNPNWERALKGILSEKHPPSPVFLAGLDLRGSHGDDNKRLMIEKFSKDQEYAALYMHDMKKMEARENAAKAKSKRSV
ncbi:hypothetical protein BCR35DRAFT_355445 [Leucosporidium creatinivorum]|uniref:Uncharacterized protein n=1 Tax=Leucosporidium creatinivorum TaxID=106004 RepID=A0A1Y2DFG2_9BASI|nr:hypothetical protein BCR35DRAFT_355445 [Leucosporidium creatinivorum]